MKIDSSITLLHFLLVSGTLFYIGIYGFFINRKSPIFKFISLQIIFISIILTLISFSMNNYELITQALALFVFISMVVEFIIGIVILFIFYKGTRK